MEFKFITHTSLKKSSYNFSMHLTTLTSLKGFVGSLPGLNFTSFQELKIKIKKILPPLSLSLSNTTNNIILEGDYSNLKYRGHIANDPIV